MHTFKIKLFMISKFDKNTGITHIKIKDVGVDEFVLLLILKMMIVLVHKAIQQLLKFLI